MLNIHSELLDTPDFFWDYVDLEKFYKLVVTYLDKDQRIEVLNK